MENNKSNLSKIRNKVLEIFSSEEDIIELSKVDVDVDKDIKLTIVDDGEYELSDGRVIIIEGDKVLEIKEVDPQKTAEEESKAAEEEKNKAAEEEKVKMEKETKLSKLEETIENLKLEIIKLNKVEPITNAPIVSKKEKLEINDNMTYTERIRARIINNNLK